MIKVTLIGTGNVSWHLNEVFKKTDGVQVIEILSSRSDLFLKTFQKGKTQTKSDVYILAVSDDVIDSIAQQLKNTEQLIVHTSGSVSMSMLPKENRKGVFYPLQTLSKDREVNFNSVPICIEAEKEEDLKLLQKLAAEVSESVYEVSSEQRRSLHMAAVFVNNFTNHLYQIGSELCDQHKIPFKILAPLIAETAKKINTCTPIDAQTGPARRADHQTIGRQIDQLENKNHKEIYQKLTQSILNTYGKKL